MNFGFDLDGVVANFEARYAPLLSRLSGVQFPKLGYSDWPDAWQWDRSALEDAGISHADATAILDEAWTEVKNTSFWGTLPLTAHGAETLRTINQLRAAGHNIYFITSRPGRFAKVLSEDWLIRHDVTAPVVFIASNAADKANIGLFLELDVFIDDKPENCTALVGVAKHVYLQDAPWNKGFRAPGVHRIARPTLAVNEVLKLEGAVALKRVA